MIIYRRAIILDEEEYREKFINGTITFALTRVDDRIYSARVYREKRHDHDEIPQRRASVSPQLCIGAGRPPPMQGHDGISASQRRVSGRVVSRLCYFEAVVALFIS